MVAVVVAAGAVWFCWHSGPPAEVGTETFTSPYLNTRQGVAYVGDRVCARCHTKEAEAYHRHPMGRSLELVATAARREGLDREPVQSFEAVGSSFWVERRGRRVFHHEVFRAGGVEVGRLEAEVAYVMGSGSQGRSYLVRRDGYLFQSPISWYAPRQEVTVADWFFPRPSWDLSPGYHQNLQHFNRPITAACLFCHGDRAAPVEHSLNHYHTPAFKGQSSIGCERCHGPGELHVASRQRGETAAQDLTIVNPGKLEPALRDAVCQQCHLQGEFRVERRGRKLEDYRPGLPLQDYLTVFVRPPELIQNHKSVSHVQQMEMSRCFQKSVGENKLGCISCHDPHAPIDAAARATHYRSRCLSCHQAGGGSRSATAERPQRRVASCSLPTEQRRARKDNCIACHMPSNRSANIVHAAVTDHRILRHPARSSGLREQSSPSVPPLQRFHQALPGKDDPELERDLGVALATSARATGDDQVRQQLTRAALPSLDGAVQAHPEDLEATADRGFCLKVQNRLAEALQMTEAVLAREPARELALFDALEITMGLGQPDAALRYARRLLKVNPFAPHYQLLMAKLRADRGQWQQGIAACRAALRLDPGFIPARAILIQCYARSGTRDRARAELKVLLALNPPRPKDLQAWFDAMMSE